MSGMPMRINAFLALLLLAPFTHGSQFADQAVERLSKYIQVRAENPPGNEIRGVEFFARIFDAAGIEYEIAESAPGRANIWETSNGGDCLFKVSVKLEELQPDALGLTATVVNMRDDY